MQLTWTAAFAVYPTQSCCSYIPCKVQLWGKHFSSKLYICDL